VAVEVKLFVEFDKHAVQTQVPGAWPQGRAIEFAAESSIQVEKVFRHPRLKIVDPWSAWWRYVDDQSTPLQQVSENRSPSTRAHHSPIIANAAQEVDKVDRSGLMLGSRRQKGLGLAVDVGGLDPRLPH
jgi:hypothetical protein